MAGLMDGFPLICKFIAIQVHIKVKEKFLLFILMSLVFACLFPNQIGYKFVIHAFKSQLGLSGTYYPFSKIITLLGLSIVY